MSMVRLGIIGDYSPGNPTHRATGDAIRHASDAIGVPFEADWIPTASLDTDPATTLEAFDGLWCAPGSPYASLAGALNGVRFARETGRPFLGTCGGFQHAVLEYARNVLGIADADHAEYDPYASNLFVSRLACSLKGRTMSVRIREGSLARAGYASAEAEEQYYCNFGLSPESEALLHDGGLVVVGVDQDGEARIVELADHRHFIATLFVPQVNSRPSRPHPLVLGFLNASLAASCER